MTITEETSSYSDPSGIHESSRSYNWWARITARQAQEFFVYHINDYISPQGERLEGDADHALDFGHVTLASTQSFELAPEQLDEQLWKLQWLYKYELLPLLGEHIGAAEIEFETRVMAHLLETHLSTDPAHAHLLIFQKLGHIGEDAVSKNMRKAMAGTRLRCLPMQK